MTEKNQAERSISQDREYAVVSVDGAFCRLDRNVTHLIFFQDIYHPKISTDKSEGYVAIDTVERSLKFEVRIPTENFLELMRMVALTWGLRRGLDKYSAEEKTTPPEGAMWVESPSMDNLEPSPSLKFGLSEKEIIDLMKNAEKHMAGDKENDTKQ